jgi:hypothetical protein
MKAAIIAGCAMLSVLCAAPGAHAINIWSLKCGDAQIDGEVVKDKRWQKSEDHPRHKRTDFHGVHRHHR